MSKLEGIPTSNFEQVCSEGVFMYSNTGNVVSHGCAYKRSSYPDSSSLYETMCMKFGDEGICFVVKIEEEARLMKFKESLLFENEVVVCMDDIVKITREFSGPVEGRVITWHVDQRTITIDTSEAFKSSETILGMDKIVDIQTLGGSD